MSIQLSEKEIDLLKKSLDIYILMIKQNVNENENLNGDLFVAFNLRDKITQYETT